MNKKEIVEILASGNQEAITLLIEWAQAKKDLQAIGRLQDEIDNLRKIVASVTHERDALRTSLKLYLVSSSRSKHAVVYASSPEAANGMLPEARRGVAAEIKEARRFLL